jgi:hypothetical protein
VPEEAGSTYRPDFQLYFLGRRRPVPVEIKWSSRSFTKPNQVKALRAAPDGFLAAFDEPEIDVPHVVLDESEFRSWLVSRIDSLWDEAYASNVRFTARDGKWLVVLKGPEAVSHFREMHERHGPDKAFWAFRNRHALMRQLLRVRTGDQVVFVELRIAGGFTNIPLHRRVLATVLGAYFGLVRQPYYMVMKGPKATFFGDDEDVTKRRWPHYIGFSLTERTGTASFASGDVSESLWSKITESHNRGTVPLPLLQHDWEELLALLPPRESID